MLSRAMIVVGGGTSTRFGTDKLMVEIDGRPLITHTIDAVVSQVDLCVVVCRPEVVGFIGELHDDVTVTVGGTTRTASELAGLAALGTEVELIGVHDAARPVIDAAMINHLYETAHLKGGALPLLGYDHLVVDKKTQRPVTGLRGAQTPQVFRGPALMAAYAKAAQAGFHGHDTLEVVQTFSDVKVAAIEGNPENLKVTYPADLDVVSGRLSGSSHT